MRQVLVADKNLRSRQQLVSLLTAAGHEVLALEEVSDVLNALVSRQGRVLVLGSEVGALRAVELLPLLKRCCREVPVILVAEESSLPLLRRMRREGIFYHALPPRSLDDQRELALAVRCALNHLDRQPSQGHIPLPRTAGRACL